MVELINGGVYLYDQNTLIQDKGHEEINASLAKKGHGPVAECEFEVRAAKNRTMARSVMNSHSKNNGTLDELNITFDALVSHDITYVGIVQTARASGLERFPLPYALTNCHNSLCAVGGTINEDDHLFGLSAAKKYGGVYVPAHLAVIHAYAREMMTKCGSMILGSDSHTRYGALGTMGVGEGGPELVKQLLLNTYDIPAPPVVAVYLEGAPKPGVGPHDVAIALIAAVFKSGFVKNSVLEFVGPGVANLSADYRCGIDVMTTETTCLSSIWTTDKKIQRYFERHGRKQDYCRLTPGKMAYYDKAVLIDLSKIECMIALPFHPSNAYTIDQFNANCVDILAELDVELKGYTKNAPSLLSKLENGKLRVDQGVIAGCAGGTYENIVAAAAILAEQSTGNGAFSLSVYPQSQPVNLALTRCGVMGDLMGAGAVIRTAFCGPCFGAGDVPANGGLSIRHSTRNFPSREGSKPGSGQIASVALMDARSIAATAKNGGLLTPATSLGNAEPADDYTFDSGVYGKRVYFGWGEADTDAPLVFGPNIADWPSLEPLSEDVLLKVITVIHDPVTTTDELIPSGETSSYRSNPLKLAEFTLSRRDPEYVAKSKAVRELEGARLAGGRPQEVTDALERLAPGFDLAKIAVGSAIFAKKPGDGSAREQAASCQRVLGGLGNICNEYATKRYRSNLINWGILPFTTDHPFEFEADCWLYVKGIRQAIQEDASQIPALLRTGDQVVPLTLSLGRLTSEEKAILLRGCLINYYKSN